MNALEVIATGALATVQDLGRPGAAALGVGASGAVDLAALRLGNRLLANDEGAAGIEVTLGGLEVRAHRSVRFALTGAPCPATVDGHGIGCNAPEWLRAGSSLVLGVPTSGMRTYLTVRGGIDVPKVIGSRSTDVLAGLGPDPLAPGAVLPIGRPPPGQPIVDLAPVPAPETGEVTLRFLRGPRADWFTSDALASLTGAPYEVTASSNRVGMRLRGPELKRRREAELPTEGMVVGALQVPPSGQPTLLLADHPLTGGYPVIGVVVTADLGRAAQARPGQTLRFREVR